MDRAGALGVTLTIYGAPPPWNATANSPQQKLANLAAKDQTHQTGQALYIWVVKYFGAERLWLTANARFKLAGSSLDTSARRSAGLRTACPICSRSAFSGSWFHPIYLVIPRYLQKAWPRYRIRASLPLQSRRFMTMYNACVSLSAKYPTA